MISEGELLDTRAAASESCRVPGYETTALSELDSQRLLRRDQWPATAMRATFHDVVAHSEDDVADR